MNEHPKVFISYSHSSDEYVDFVTRLAEKLVLDGTDVVFDRWDLKYGQDLQFFMEQSSRTDKVLILCDKKYTEKANNREGGVGTETQIMTPEIYGKADQNKFIPVIMESWDYRPVYLKSRFAIDFREGYRSEGYKQIVRQIYEVPEVRKPDIGKRPKWLDEPRLSAKLDDWIIDDEIADDGSSQGTSSPAKKNSSLGFGGGGDSASERERLEERERMMLEARERMMMEERERMR